MIQTWSTIHNDISYINISTLKLKVNYESLRNIQTPVGVVHNSSTPMYEEQTELLVQLYQ